MSQCEHPNHLFNGTSQREFVFHLLNLSLSFQTQSKALLYSNSLKSDRIFLKQDFKMWKIKIMKKYFKIKNSDTFLLFLMSN